MADCESEVRTRMDEYGAVELAPAYAEAAGRLASYIEDVKESWRVWLGFGTGVRRTIRRPDQSRDETQPQDDQPA
jgi:hypothetical protein